MDKGIQKLLRSAISELDLVNDLQRSSPEVVAPCGLYVLLSQQEELDRTFIFMGSIEWLLRGNYHALVAPQAPEKLMIFELWQELLQCVQWLGISSEMVQVVLVSLALPGLGKAFVLLHQPSPMDQVSTDALVHMIEFYLRLMSSLLQLSTENTIWANAQYTRGGTCCKYLRVT